MEKNGIINRKYSIKNRLVKNFMLIIVITVFFLIISIISGIKHYYYKNIEELMGNQLDFSVDYLINYLDLNPLEGIVMDDIDLFWNQTTAQIQLYNKDGNLLLDSIGVDFSNSELASDLERALGGSKGVWTGYMPYYEGEVMSISKPIIKDNKLVGVLRFTSSMIETKELVINISLALISVGAIVVIISGIVSYFLANSIVRPLKEVTEVAEKMADGQLDIKSKVELDDEIGKLSQTLNYMSREILKKEEIKNDFISSISHELKTPLTSIKGWAITLQGEDFSRDSIIPEGLKIIEDESDRLSDMLEELLDFSRFVSGDITLRKMKISLKEVLERTYKQLLPIARLKDLDLKLEIIGDLDFIVGDKDRMKQILINLLDNAFKFSNSEDSVFIKAFKQDGFAVIKVIDSGIGIAKEELPHITEKFYKGRTSNSHTGIGLSIVDEIVRLHNGLLEIRSEINIGTEITIKLPLGDV